MKFKNSLFIILFLVATILGCKKDEPSIGGSGNFRLYQTISPTLPPAGFSFPKTYYQSQNISDFHVWINNVDKTNLFTTQYFFKYPLTFIDFNLKLDDITSMEIIDPSGKNPTTKCNYYFFRDTLFVINLIFPDTVPFAVGSFNSFILSTGNYYLSMRDSFSSTTSSGGDFFILTKDYILSKYSYSISQIDTLALYNNSITFK